MASMPEEPDLVLESAGAVSQVEQHNDTSELTVPIVSSDLVPVSVAVKSEEKSLSYMISTDSSADVSVVAPSCGQNVTATTPYTVDGKNIMPVMNVTSVGGAGIPIIQPAGFPMSTATSGSKTTNQATMSMMIQGVGGSGPLTLIYPAVVAANASSMTSTNPTSANTTVVMCQADTVSLPSGVITVTPQTDTMVLPSGGDLLSGLMNQDNLELKHAPETQKEMIDISELAAVTPSIHNAITSQIIMQIKNEGAAPAGEQTEEKANSSDGNIRSPTTTTGDESEEGIYTPKAKRVKSSSSMSKEDKICRVCGDRALGCNFDAISCESCKAFFRRNAMKEKQPKCLFEGNCKIDVNTRRFCPFCRLQKCFAVGMKKELILGEVEKKKRNEKVRMNREKRSSKSTPVQQPVSTSVVDTLAPVTAATPVSPVLDTSPGTQQSVSSVASHEVLVHSLTSQSPKQESVLQNIQSSSGILGMGLTLGGMSFAMAGSSLQQSNSLPSVPITAPDVTNLLSLSKFAQKNELSASAQLDTYLVRHLTAEENNMLQELMQVYDLSFTVDLEPLIHIKHLDPSLNQLVNQSSITVLRLIKFAKRLEEFIRLTQQCQIGILKGTWIHILLLRSVSLYDSERDVWVTPKGDIPTEILKNATGFVKLHDDHVRYCKNIKAIIRDDLMIVVILLVIVLFSPEGPNVINRDLVSNIQDKYLILLKHYLESKYTYVRAADMYPALMSKLKELKELAEIHGKYLLDVNPSEIEPIMLEILDLK